MPIKVYKVIADTKTYQTLNTTDERFLLEVYPLLGRNRVGDMWSPPEVFAPRPNLRAAEICGFCSYSSFAFSPQATDVLRDHLLQSGEILPLPYKGQSYSVHNVTQCIDCLDHERSEYYVPGEPDSGIKKYAFHVLRLCEGLFTIPETCGKEVLLVEGLAVVEDGFKHSVEAHGFRGLRFVEVWLGTNNLRCRT